ncbi:28S ribosomal protein S6, mitochondrial [Zancudomyces culisetae]|uniref:28S ribosomal protein S6, mitochondrial n=1 Tax=Zancudomyces culisetae TaxID=1213189 RepID=A0A1R1PCF6_ZANCU|nr:28S ribosomal protein S6, mitochondrial [Zancudomyces culisetae]OMH82357.1 28S ribosomal protein S6, mitochondrial [Zancudomyces culisetae]|eukprot:OMH78621.1 28S ribosomal protein S6, mitochondrial [Zancudomyces culisetae]
MPLYEFLTITKAGIPKVVFEDMLRTTIKSILDKGGAVRSIKPFKSQVELPYKMKKNKEWHTHGRFWLMHFYASPQVLSLISRELKNDPTTIRVNMVNVSRESSLKNLLGVPDKTIL